MTSTLWDQSLTSHEFTSKASTQSWMILALSSRDSSRVSIRTCMIPALRSRDSLWLTDNLPSTAHKSTFASQWLQHLNPNPTSCAAYVQGFVPIPCRLWRHLTLLQRWRYLICESYIGAFVFLLLQDEDPQNNSEDSEESTSMHSHLSVSSLGSVISLPLSRVFTPYFEFSNHSRQRHLGVQPCSLVTIRWCSFQLMMLTNDSFWMTILNNFKSHMWAPCSEASLFNVNPTCELLVLRSYFSTWIHLKAPCSEVLLVNMNLTCKLLFLRFRNSFARQRISHPLWILNEPRPCHSPSCTAACRHTTSHRCLSALAIN